MAVNSEQSAPYVAPGVFLPLLDRNRAKGLPNPLTHEQLQRLGVSDSLVPRTLQAFRILDLTGEDGKHTDLLEALRRAPEAEYQPLMAEWLKNAYAHVLDVVDPATADDTAVRDAFRLYNPISMQPRMITLFTSLFEAAGVRPALSKASAVARTTPAATTTGRAARLAPKPATPRASASRASTERSVIANALPASGMHPALAGLLASLPSAERGWTIDERDRFMAAFGVVLDFAIPVGMPRQAESTAEGGNAPDA